GAGKRRAAPIRGRRCDEASYGAPGRAAGASPRVLAASAAGRLGAAVESSARWIFDVTFWTSSGVTSSKTPMRDHVRCMHDVNMRQNDRDPFADGVVTVRSALELPALKRGVPEVIAGHDAL